MSTMPPILGHERVLSRLHEAQDGGRWHHAYMLEGPAGVGKHLVALRLAMRANCERDPGTRPCGECGTCKRILAGSHPDVIVVAPDEGRSSRTISVTQIRDVVRAAGYHRYSARQRFVIIDPAEAMLPAAANALLKTLEEPPDGTGFFLIATHGSALLPTIRSRCQRIRFGALSDEVLVPWLAAQQVAQPALVARLAGGCPGLALDLAQGGLDKRLELRTRLLAALGGSLDSIFGLSEDICTGSRAVWMKSAEALLDLLEDLVRDAVVLAADGDVQPIHTDIPEVISAWSSALWPNGIERCERAIQATRADLALNVTGKTALDALLTRIATELGPARKAGVPRA